MPKSLEDELFGTAPETAEKPEPVEAEPKVEAKPEAEPKPERTRDETGKFVKGEEVPAPPAAKPSAKETKPDPNAEQEASTPREKAAFAKAKDELRKRQELEQRLAASEARWAAQSPPKTPDVLADPEGYVNQNRAEIQEAQWQTTLNTSEIAARDKFGDEAVAEAQQMFKEAAQANPALWHELRKQLHPYKWAVQWAKREKFLAKAGDDPDAFIESQVTERLTVREAELKAKLEANRQPVPPPSLASASSGGRVNSEPTYTPKPFEKLFRA